MYLFGILFGFFFLPNCVKMLHAPVSAVQPAKESLRDETEMRRMSLRCSGLPVKFQTIMLN